ncbi:general secretion pathway protein GspK [Xanthobacter dioxanivorans]|uniref:General secretion pathway protein GspK n=1 Tax=Xanthobacter dioxanivorans TaxID=2528964 RepID=A0A974SJ57_9HYPH|nr:type II secretion system protein GspK [Xanthobacter dioxanivorans]QRG08066.1 general secretion pathway protein GspK [Xanthobacter dioxanivorans]
MSAPHRPPPRQGTRGFILVAVLWILAALAGFVAVYSVYVSGTAMASAARDEGHLARSLATAAVELSAYRLVSVPKDRRPTHGEVSLRMGRASVVAEFRDEAARIDLNAAPRELLAGLFVALGAQPEAADGYADRILAFRSPPSGAQEAEAAIYRDAGLGHGPRGAPFVHVDEIWRVAGLPPALVGAALAHVTVFSGRGAVNADEADPVVRAALPDALRPAVSAPAAVPAGTAPAAPPAERSDAVRVSVRIAFDGGRQRAAEAVILVRDFGTDPYRVLSWREDLDGPMELPPRAEKARRP